MPTLTIVGAGPGLGLAIARLFGAHGYQVALIARNNNKLATLVGQLEQDGITAAGFAADVTDRPRLTAALAEAAAHFGPIDVVEYSPAPTPPAPGTLAPDLVVAGPTEVTVENLQPQIEYYLYGAITVAQAVLPAMRAAGTGTLLFSTGGGSISPNTALANVNAPQAALRNWVLNLHNALADDGVYAAHVAISAWIGSGAPGTDPAEIAPLYWDMHTTRRDAERHHDVL